MFEITRKNCYEYNLETINNDSQYFWINLKDLKLRQKVSG